MNEIVTLKNVSFQRGDKEILQDIDWNIQPDEHWGILGLNGSGKTSLLNIVSGYHFPSSGEVQVLGNLFGKTNLPELRKKIGFVSSSLDRFADFFNKEKVERVIVSGKFASFGIYEQVAPEDWEKADHLLESLRLAYLKGKPYHLLSEGEKRRVLIARALMSDPKMLILDEPCSGLDILSREQFLGVLEEVVEKKCHIIYVTHHIEELVKEITHVLLLKDGKIVAKGPKEEVLKPELLSETYKVPVTVRWEQNRPWLAVKEESTIR
ncbi:ABC transporter ATP-binding protein [Sporosarcina sp. ACRSM]|uniref:ABC transporter ATP-binding protein n=1 Tax=Sporosarcina sp. ACRSM TaxID=2918216 RepID=UPI001EF4D92D|nr:ABC transporter ATP-binding protein [Sporosarcina sp. ACRSM]MCG7335749.1 ABC transporter ATP-binding protein [Sporosarcina sp. ACRSM]